IEANQTKLLSAIAAKVQSWGPCKISIAGQCIAANVFLLSKVWYLAHIVPFQKSFFVAARRLLQRWVWAPSKHPPARLEVLHGDVEKGGLGLLDLHTQSHAILSKFLTPTLSCANYMGIQPEWAEVAHSLMSKSLGLVASSKTALPAYFLSPKYKLPSWEKPKAWREYVMSIRDSSMSFEVGTPGEWPGLGPQARATVLHINGQPHGNNELLPQPPRVITVAPLLSHAYPLDQQDNIWQPPQMWLELALKVASARWRSTTWRVLNRTFRTGDWSGPTFEHRKCCTCPLEVTTHEHRYFQCQAVSHLWARIARIIPGVLPPPDWDPLLDPMFSQLWPKLPRSLRAILYHATIWACHCVYLDTSLNQLHLPPQVHWQKLCIAVENQIKQVYCYKGPIAGCRKETCTWRTAAPEWLQITISPTEPPQ
ncbi:hypothetical protein FRX31_007467, partial [Thalictrum thalictroides]